MKKSLIMTTATVAGLGVVTTTQTVFASEAPTENTVNAITNNKVTDKDLSNAETLKKQRKLHQKKSKRKPKMLPLKKKLKPTKKLMPRIRPTKLVTSLMMLNEPKTSLIRLVQMLKKLIES